MKCRYCEAKLTVNLGSIRDVHRAGLFCDIPVSGIANLDLSLLLCSRCKLVQLAETGISIFDQYGEDYGYRSGLNRQMVAHLGALAAIEMDAARLSPGDAVLEVGANDGTHLRFFDSLGLDLIAVDPTLRKFEEYYDFCCRKIATFFPSPELEMYKSKISLISSHACFYDLPKIRPFVEFVINLLKDGGVWSFEQSYLPLMIENNAFDSICDEHLEFYTLYFLSELLKEYGLVVEHVSFNNINGGSVHILARKSISEACFPLELRGLECGYDNIYDVKCNLDAFWMRVEINKKKVRDILNTLKGRGRVYAAGASTKGSIILQHYAIGELLDGVLEINPEKYGRYMAGTNAVIIDESKCDLAGASILVLPWHYGEPLVRKYLTQKANVVLPLPDVKVFYAS